LSVELAALWEAVRPAFGERSTWELARRLGMSGLTCLGRHTVTGLLTASGHQHQDWSAAYRLFTEHRLPEAALWQQVRQGVLAALPEEAPVVGALDDTLLPRWGRKVAGTAWRRDPLGPRFQANLIWAQRMVQTTLLLPEGPGARRARALPVDLQHAPSPRRPRPQAGKEAWAEYREAQRTQGLSAVGQARVEALRTALDEDGAQGRTLLLAVDGGYTNRTLFRQLPARTTLVGRVRKDAALFAKPDPSLRPGRPRVYGPPLPTPEQLRQDDSLPWQAVTVYVAGAGHELEVKVVTPVRWRGAGARDLQLVIVRPLAYRPRAQSRLLYRQPAYLLCTDPKLPLATLLQAYVWRWEAEVTFREEKSLLGMGQAQVRTAPAVAAVPAFVAAMYSFLHLAAHRAAHTHPGLARPRWQRPAPTARLSTGQLQGLLRAELWGAALGIDFRDFAAALPSHAKPLKLLHPLAAAVCYAAG
jgi:hypothetical protein